VTETRAEKLSQIVSVSSKCFSSSRYVLANTAMNIKKILPVCGISKSDCSAAAQVLPLPLLNIFILLLFLTHISCPPPSRRPMVREALLDCSAEGLSACPASEALCSL
jgi:hypothetical protein